jgi:hypothetical protein
MAFLDNSGDIILDAVLTDTGRFRLAKGDGSFKIVKFAFGDDEINYRNFDSTHTSGSAYYDLEILQTPVLEAFTNNTSMLKSKLVTIPRTNLLYLPVLRLATDSTIPQGVTGVSGSGGTGLDSQLGNGYGVNQSNGTYIVTCTENLEADIEDTTSFLHGATVSSQVDYIRIDQGLHTTNISQAFVLDPDLKEDQYIIQMDHRLGTLLTPAGKTPTPVSFIDDDNIATYYVSGDAYVKSPNPSALKTASGTDIGSNGYFACHGPMGTVLKLNIGASINLNTSNYLFQTLGGNQTTTFGGQTVKFIDTIIKVTGASTGYTLNVPVRYIKEN